MDLYGTASNPQGLQGRLPVGRSGRPIGGVSAANCREIKMLDGLYGAQHRTRRVRKGDCPSAFQAAPSEA
jgi:hypothetical protein